MLDPVCGANLTVLEYEECIDLFGARYCFCSRECKEAFLKDPERYVGEESALWWGYQGIA
jgi:YHS domain-containing protein